MTDPIIDEIVKELSAFNPKSVFLYGSRGRGDALPGSDYEVGVVFDDESYAQLSKIQEAISNPAVKAYPFKWSELSTGTFSHVFQKSIYLREIIEGGKTIAGEDVIPVIQPLPITMLDLIQRVRFDIGIALAALLSYRSGDMKTSMEEFSKSCLFGLRCLEILELNEFPVGYKEIYELADKLDGIGEHKHVLDAAYSQRLGSKPPAVGILYENISFLDTFIEPKIIDAFNRDGNIELIDT